MPKIETEISISRQIMRVVGEGDGQNEYVRKMFTKSKGMKDKLN